MGTHNTGLWGREPALVLGFVQAAIALGVSFGLDLSAEQIGSLLAVSAALLALLTRSQVTPTKSTQPEEKSSSLPIAGLVLAALLAGGCAGRAETAPPVNPLALAHGVSGALLVAEQAQAIEAIMYLTEAEPDPSTHCRIQRAFGAFARNAENAIHVVFDLSYPGADRTAALRALVDGSRQALDLVSHRLSPEEQVAWRAALAAGTVAVMTITAQRLPQEAPPEVLLVRDQALAGLLRMSALAAKECPDVAP